MQRYSVNESRHSLDHSDSFKLSTNKVMKLETNVAEKNLTVIEMEKLSETHNTEDIIKQSLKVEFDVRNDTDEQPLLESIDLLTPKWSTGAGARIGCLREYPSDLQCKALEHVNLSPTRCNKTPIPSPRPSPRVRLSPQLAQMCIHIPTISLTLPNKKKKA